MSDLISDDAIDDETTSSSQIQISSSEVASSTLSRLKAKITGMLSSAVRRWPSVCTSTILVLIRYSKVAKDLYLCNGVLSVDLKSFRNYRFNCKTV